MFEAVIDSPYPAVVAVAVADCKVDYTAAAGRATVAVVVVVVGRARTAADRSGRRCSEGGLTTELALSVQGREGEGDVWVRRLMYERERGVRIY